jgi:type IV fimbrial biogenesis protein FimT
MNRPLGFTLIELIVTVALAAILLTIGVPSFQEMMRNNRAATHTNEMLTALNFARSEAVKRGRDVLLCPSTDPANWCVGTDWSGGWIVFADLNNNGAADAGEILRVWEALSGNPTFTGPATMGYQPTGEGVAGAASFAYTLDTRNYLVCVNPVGRPSIEKDATVCP